MPTFTYNALDPAGKAARGTLTADSRTAALDDLAGRGLMPVSVEGGEAAPTSNAPTSWQLGGKRVSPVQVEAFTREIANLLSAGVPLARALHILRREASNA